MDPFALRGKLRENRANALAVSFGDLIDEPGVRNPDIDRLTFFSQECGRFEPGLELRSVEGYFEFFENLIPEIHVAEERLTF
jgi:hypothetical protein